MIAQTIITSISVNPLSRCVPPKHIICPILSWYTHSASHLHARDIPFTNTKNRDS